MTLHPPQPLPADLPAVVLAQRALDRFRDTPTITLDETLALLRTYGDRARAEGLQGDAERILGMAGEAAEIQAAHEAAITRAALLLKAAPDGTDALTAWYAAMLGIVAPYTPPAILFRPTPPTGPTPQEIAQQARTRAPVPTAPYTLTALTDAPAPARLVVVAPDRAAAQRQLWRHVANRMCLAILADARLPLGSPSLSVPSSTRPPPDEPRTMPGGDCYRVEVDPLTILLDGETVQTPRLKFTLHVVPQSTGARLALDMLRRWPAPTTTEPLYRYRSNLRQLARRDGLSGDMVALFEELCRPDAAFLLDALGD